MVFLFGAGDEESAEEHAKKITTQMGGDLWSGRRGSNSLPGKVALYQMSYARKRKVDYSV